MDSQGGNFEILIPAPSFSLDKIFSEIKSMQRDNLNDIQLEARDDRTEEEVKGLKFIARKIKILLEKNKRIEYNEASRILISNFASEEKAERNIKRRVYDAINVLVSAGVIAKDDNKIQLFHDRSHPPKAPRSLDKPQMLAVLHDREAQLEARRASFTKLRQRLDLLKKIISKKAAKKKREIIEDQIMVGQWGGAVKEVSFGKGRGRVVIREGKFLIRPQPLASFIASFLQK